MSLIKLSDYKNNIFSQSGEDGIIEEIFNIIPHESKICVEFGAWDGIYLSNTANLWKNKDWNAILIESDSLKFKSLLDNSNNKKVNAINAFVGLDSNKNSIDFILNSYNIKNVDLLSIDIDSNDYYVFEGLICEPSLIIVEYNPTIPYFFDCYQKSSADQANAFGCSLGSLLRVGEIKGYFLACTTSTNAFFIHKKYKELFSKYELKLQEIICTKYYEFTITNYSGDYLKIGSTPYGKRNVLNTNDIIFK